MREYRFVTADAFTTSPFTGNPCAILPEAEGLASEEMQAIANELNLSETAFVLPSDCAAIRVRYFTPRNEIPFAGHPTIAAVFALAEQGRFPLEEPITTIDVEFGIGVLPVDIEVADGRPIRVIMTQQTPTFGATIDRGTVAAGLGLGVDDLIADLPCQVVSTGVGFLMVPVADRTVLERIAMDRPRLRAVCHAADVPAAYAFSRGGFSQDTDLHARFFDPNGTGEDPFTGSACGAMAAYASHVGLVNRPSMIVEQGHFVGRPGVAVATVDREGARISRVRLGGRAVTVSEGTMHVPPAG